MGSHKEKKSKDKSRKHKKEKKHSSDKRRRRDSSDSESSALSEDDRKRHKSEKLASKVAQHLEKVGQATGAAPFVWTKKVEKELHQGKKLKDISIFSDANRVAERLEEIEKVRKRQAEREAEKAQREEELSMVQRMRAAQEALESEAKEEEFYLKAMVSKSERRLQEGRPEPIDLIAKNLHLVEEFDFELEDPWRHFSGLLLENMERVADEIKEFKEYDKYDELHGQFWEALHVISQQELDEARKRDAADRALIRANRAAAGGAALPEESKLAVQERGLHPDVEEDIEGMLQGQSLGELTALEQSVEQALQTGDGDPEYWEAVQKRLRIYKAKAQVRDIMSKLFGRAIKQMRAATDKAAAAAAAKDGEAGPSKAPAAGEGEEEEHPLLLSEEDDREWQELEEEAKRVRAAAAAAAGGTRADGDAEAAGEPPGTSGAAAAAAGVGAAAPRAGSEPPAAEEPRTEEHEEEEDEDLVLNDGRFSPPPVDRALVHGQEIIPEEADQEQLELLRQQVLLQEAQRFKAASNTMASISGPGYGTGIGIDNEMRLVRASNRGVHPMFRNLASEAGEQQGFRTGREGTDLGPDVVSSFKNASLKLMGNDEGDREFGGEVSLESTVYWWHEKYKPRKPKYFNRVHTGYEWNKYNQTHYDSDNPPPKVVQGYKFNILYHDLIDKSKAPEYRIERDPESADNSTCMLRFTAGPPYEDIAFRIVNKEWEYSHKRGFRCTFERGILHLYFNFMRTRYRR